MEEQRTLELFGKRLGEVRRRHELTQAELADAVPCHRTYITQLEAGSKNPTLTTLVALAVALEVPIGELFPDQMFGSRRPVPPVKNGADPWLVIRELGKGSRVYRGHLLILRAALFHGLPFWQQLHGFKPVTPQQVARLCRECYVQAGRIPMATFRAGLAGLLLEAEGRPLGPVCVRSEWIKSRRHYRLELANTGVSQNTV